MAAETVTPPAAATSGIFQSASGLAHSKTLRAIRAPPEFSACVLDCGSPPPLFPGTRQD